ncbi:Golgi membrane protein 1 isoform X1 [Lampris incognitus]|uniref:Golgi membrane protein 1 isoform X1 n=1 Tax=Lampris incognitus TaxID=2546036 RepID=UPI0024B56A87|nr:Golgi membrane protein 1 isoform X1 [Lampris incognitus]
MVGLGNSRRSGRSPPLMIGALIACILVLGFNYWVSSSRNLELQTKLYELEGQVRRGAVERGAAEMKKNEFQEEIQRQKEQISRIENLYKRQLEGTQNTCSQDKGETDLDEETEFDTTPELSPSIDYPSEGTLQLNISSNTKTIQELRDQLNQLKDDLGKLQKELQSCQGNLNTLNKKLTYDMTQCNTQILSQKELCDERVAAIKIEVKKKMEKLIPAEVVSSQVNAVPTQKLEGPVKKEELEKTGVDETKMTPVLSHKPDLTHPKANEPPELLTNEIIEKGQDEPVAPLSKDLFKHEPQSVPSAAAVKEETLLPPEEIKTEGGAVVVDKLLKNQTEGKEVEVIDAHGKGTQIEAADPGVEDMLIDQGKTDESPVGHKAEDPEDYDGDEQIVGEADSEKTENQMAENIDKAMEEELADYNGDDDNEGEYEADKQAELAQN